MRSQQGENCQQIPKSIHCSRLANQSTNSQNHKRQIVWLKNFLKTSISTLASKSTSASERWIQPAGSNRLSEQPIVVAHVALMNNFASSFRFLVTSSPRRRSIFTSRFQIDWLHQNAAIDATRRDGVNSTLVVSCADSSRRYLVAHTGELEQLGSCMVHGC